MLSTGRALRIQLSSARVESYENFFKYWEKNEQDFFQLDSVQESASLETAIS
jgi:hypothetical protein